MFITNNSLIKKGLNFYSINFDGLELENKPHPRLSFD